MKKTLPKIIVKNLNLAPKLFNFIVVQKVKGQRSTPIGETRKIFGFRVRGFGFGYSGNRGFGFGVGMPKAYIVKL